MKLSRMIAALLSRMIAVYQRTLSLALGPRCRSYPSCSQYARACLDTYPLGHAVWKTSRRLISCHPFHPGGIDLP